jgi:hypothetical protein
MQTRVNVVISSAIDGMFMSAKLHTALHLFSSPNEAS